MPILVSPVKTKITSRHLPTFLAMLSLLRQDTKWKTGEPHPKSPWHH